MATRFDFDSSFISTAVQLERANLTPGGIIEDDIRPGWFNAVSPAQSISTLGGVDVFAVTLVAGQQYDFDTDNAKLNLQLDIIDQAGRLVKTVDGTTNDVLLERFSPTQTGQYYIAIRHADNEYLGNQSAGSLDWQRDTSSNGPQTGSYQFRFSASPESAYQPGSGRTYNLSDARNTGSTSGSADEVRANGGNDDIQLLGGNDIALGGSGNDVLSGGYGDDDIMGDSGSDLLFGGFGNDVLRGGMDNDRLYGESGNDGLVGGSGSDLLIGGGGVDIMTGGSGADTFRFRNGEANASSTASSLTLDSIQDFSRAQGDKIDLRYVDSDTDALVWRGTGSFTADNQVRAQSAGNGYLEIQVNLDTDAAAELEFLVRPTSGTIGASDFLL